MIIPWHHGAIVITATARSPRFSYRLRWLHCQAVSAHLAIIYFGKLRIVRFRPSDHHARRLGLPVI